MEKAQLKELYTISEAIIATGLGKTSIYNLIKEGKFKAKKFGCRTLIPKACISEWLSSLPNKTLVGGENEK